MVSKAVRHRTDRIIVFRYGPLTNIEREHTVRLYKSCISRRNLGAISSDLSAISAPPLELGDELGQVGAELGEVALGGLARDKLRLGSFPNLSPTLSLTLTSVH